MKKITILILLIVCCLSLAVPAQIKDKVTAKKQIYLNKQKPTVYITYEKAGKLKPLYAFESENRIWLRFHNNTQQSLFLAANSAENEYGDFELFYDIDRIEKNSSDTSNKQNVPVGRLLNHTFSVISLAPGKSILFSVPKEHLAEGLALKVRFAYKWEDGKDVSANDEPKHYAYFYSSDIPQK